MNLWLPFAYAWRNMLARKLSTAVTLLAVASSVLVFVVMSATASGIRNVAANTGSPDNVVVLSKGAGSIEASILDRETLHRLHELPSVARDANGDRLISVELLIFHTVPRKGATAAQSAARIVAVRGVTASAFAVHPGVRLASGRLPRDPGDLVIGRLVPTALGPVGIGDELTFGGRTHRIVGVLDAGGQVFDGEIWADLDDLRNESEREGASTAILRAESRIAVPALLEHLDASRIVRVEAKPEPKYYEVIRQASGAFVYLGNVIAVIMGAGAVLAGMNTMYAAMSRRVREMGTLRALGFGRSMVGGLLLLESVLIGCVGGLIGSGLALLFDGYALNLVGLAFEVDVNPENLTQAAVLSAAIGICGGWLPARAAARLDIVTALRHA